MTSDQTNKTLLPLILVAAGILVLAGAGVWLAVGQSPVSPSDTATEDSIARLTAEESHAAIQSGQAVILDVRGAQYYEALRIAGALSIPLDELEARVSELDPNLQIITYCT
jgi:hypothetical protein